METRGNHMSKGEYPVASFFRQNGRRAGYALLSVVTVVLGGLCEVAPAAEIPVVRAGVLAFGTVNWELDVIAHHGLDHKHGFRLEVVKLASADAGTIALQGDATDTIVTNWLWVSKRRHDGADYTFVPHSLTVGGLMVRPDAGINTIADLRGKRIGVAGGPSDKSWLLLRAYGIHAYGFDLNDAASPAFAAPPLLNQIMLRGEIPAALNFWHYHARLRAGGMRELITVSDMLSALGIKRAPPLIGWVFSEAWAAKSPAAVKGFLDSLRAAKEILAASDAEWARLRPLTRAEDDATFAALREGYRAGIPKSFGPEDVAAAEATFEVLARVGGPKLVGAARALTPGTFWAGYQY